MPPWIIAAVPVVLAAFAAVITGALVVGPFVLPLYFRTLRRDQLERLRAATKGAFYVVSEIAKRTPTTLDDDVAKVLDMVERELGKSLTPAEKRVVVNIARSLHAEPGEPTLSPALR